MLEILCVTILLFYKKSWVFCENSSYKSQTYLCINKIRIVIRLLAKDGFRTNIIDSDI